MPNPGHTLVLAMCQAPSASRDACAAIAQAIGEPTPKEGAGD